MMGKRLKLSDKALLASVKVAGLIVKKKKPHNIGRNLFYRHVKKSLK
jgi:hypothetical protein